MEDSSASPRDVRNNSGIVSFLTQLKRKISQTHCLQIKSPLCHHEQGCILHSLQGAFRSLCIAYGVKTLFGLISILLGMKKHKISFMKILTVFIENDTLRFASFPALYALIQKSILCYFRNTNDQDKKIFSFISGCVGGFLSLLVLKPEKRSTWAFFLSSRSLDIMFQSLQNRGIIKKRKYYFVVFFAFITLFTSYAYGSESECLEEYMHKFYIRFSCETIIDKDFRYLWHVKKVNILDY